MAVSTWDIRLRQRGRIPRMAWANVHPFPARMASDLALAKVKSLRPKSTVLDPMMGSGTVLLAASSAGHRCIGFDLDPLSILISKVATRAKSERIESVGIPLGGEF